MANNLKTFFWLMLMTMILLVIGGAVGGRGGMTIALVLAGVMNFVSYFFSDKIALSSSGAVAVSREEAPRLYEIMERLCLRANLPTPRLHIIPSESPNAFATGRNPQHAAVAVTAGAMNLLDDSELEGVLGHELAHVAHRDILLASVAATMAGAITWAAHMVYYAELFGGGGRDDRDRGGGVFTALALMILGPIAATLVQLAISRSREYAADATGAQFAGTPFGLANALRKLETYSAHRPLMASQATAHMYIVKPAIAGGLGNLFSTHPPTAERIARLTGMRVEG